MNILLGICGFGFGHTMRQSFLLDHLNKRGHNVALFVFDQSQRYMTRHFPQNKAFEVKVPVMHVKNGGLNFKKIAEDPYNQYSDGNLVNYMSMQQTFDLFGGAPDLVLSDYEMIAAQYAYATGAPLVTVDQHSKFAGFQLPDVGSFSRMEEKHRLEMFFPRAEARLTTSFFELVWPEDPTFSVQMVPLVLRKHITPTPPTETSNKILVYISPHAKITQTPDEIIEQFFAFPDKRFIYFQREEQESIRNVQFEAFGKDSFLKHLTDCDCVITTAGHMLLSELVILNKPVLTIPIATYDQQFCAYAVEKTGMGQRCDVLTPDTLRTFFEGQPEHVKNLVNKNGLVKQVNGIEVVLETLDRMFGV